MRSSAAAALDALADAVLELAAIVDRRGRVLSSSARWRGFFGDPGPATIAELNGRVHVDDRSLLAGCWSEATARRARVENVLRVTDARGELTSMRSVFMPIAGPRARRWCVTFLDIRAAASNDDVVQRPGGAIGSTGAASEVSRAASADVLAVFGHDFRRSLNAVVGWTHLLRRPGLDESTRREGLDLIERNAREQARLVKVLLDASAVLAGVGPGEREPVSLRDCVDAALGEVQRAGDDTHDWQVVWPEELPHVLARRGDLQEVALAALRAMQACTPPAETIAVVAALASGLAEVVVSARPRDASGGTTAGARQPLPPVKLSLELAIARVTAQALGGHLDVEIAPEWGRLALVRFGFPLAGRPPS